jgi:hypothetical protein
VTIFFLVVTLARYLVEVGEHLADLPGLGLQLGHQLPLLAYLILALLGQEAVTRGDNRGRGRDPRGTGGGAQ